jgi:hypothetical protein
MRHRVRYLGTGVTNQNLTDEEIESRLNSSNFNCHSDQNILSPHLLSKNVNINMYKITALLVAL